MFPAAAHVTALSIAVMILTGGSTSEPRPCRFASQAGSLYEIQVPPDASSHTSALSGRSEVQLSRPVSTVAGVAKTRQDERVLIQPLIDAGRP